MLIQELHIFLLSMTPIGELRVAIPVGLVAYNLNWFYVFVISVLGNLVPVVLLLMFLEKTSNYLSKKSQTFKRFFAWLFERTRKKYNSKIEKYDWLALMVFVAIPLPITGAWTASLVAFLFGIPFKKAFISIFSGIMIAGLIVSFVTKTGIAIEKYFGWQIIIGILLLLTFILLIYYKIKKIKTV
jgi:uncharacterized membrane protein